MRFGSQLILMKKRKDVLTKKQRSYCMSRVRSKDTKVEVLMRSNLFKKGYRFRKHTKDLAGKPDIVFRSLKLAIFIDGDFWHGRNFANLQKQLSPFWKKKIEDNIKRDIKNFKSLRAMGWKVVRIWEKDYYKAPANELDKLVSTIESLKKCG